MIDIIDRSTHQLQYGANQLADLPRSWNSRGRDPFRESRAVAQIKVTDPEAFLAIKQAQSLEAIRDLLMALPSEVVLAGLDGEPVPRYDVTGSGCTEVHAERRLKKLLKPAGAVATKIILTPSANGAAGKIEITLLCAEVNNERYRERYWKRLHGLRGSIECRSQDPGTTRVQFPINKWIFCLCYKRSS